jgi:hypothetical protein
LPSPWRLRRAWLALLLARRRRRGARGETGALGLLARNGYAIIARRERAVGRLVVDGEELEFDLEADAIVEKHGRRLVAEVKTGASAAVKNRATRRQLLEYAWVYGLDGVLLVDMAEDRIIEVGFPDLHR